MFRVILILLAILGNTSLLLASQRQSFFLSYIKFPKFTLPSIQKHRIATIALAHGLSRWNRLVCCNILMWGNNAANRPLDFPL
ncbi:hypothetical protein DL98DRAFT_257540 [Cadophora sp. DSE1049]|nr:hypothetical protein DL98DRAFT_257540 [Cadophora sp. DSE1049]